MALTTRTILGLVAIFFASTALAGAPLKGVDVKLGKNPGGTVAERTTGDDGTVNFGVLPPLKPGETYTLTLRKAGRDQPLTLTIRSGTPAMIVKEMDRTSTLARADAPDLSFSSDGKKPLIISIAAAKVKSHSNTNNN